MIRPPGSVAYASPSASHPHPTGDQEGIIARLDGICPTCLNPIRWGDQLTWQPSIGWTHQTCGQYAGHWPGCPGEPT